MHIGILETGETPAELRDEHGSFPDMFRRLLAGRGLTFSVWRVHAGEFPPGPEAAEGWLITGSKAGVYEDHPWIPPLEEFVRRVMAARIPLVGICFGHQIMAQATGGVVVKSDRGWGLGAQVYEDLETGAEMRVLASHQDQVIELPPGVRVTARSAHCPVAGLAWEDAPAVSWQPHPEFAPAFSEALIRGRRGVLYDVETADAALASLDAPLDSSRLADRIAAFLRDHRASRAA